MRPAALLVCAALAFTAPPGSPTAAAQSPERSSGAVAMAPFHALEVTGFAQVVLVQGAKETLAVDAAPGTTAKIHVANEDGVLSIHVREERSGWKIFGGGGTSPRITVTFRNLDALQLAGAVKLEAARIAVPSLAIEATGATSLRIENLDTPSLRLEGSGAVKVEIAGRAAQQDVELSGAASYRAGELVSDDARIEVSGAGKVAVNAVRTLDVHVSGAGSVEYTGNPKVTQDVSGAARVRQRDRSSARDDAPATASG